MENKSQADGPNPVDIHVGGRVRTRRRLLGVSQEHLARCVGLTFQQIQKYERGANRISASKLYEIASALRTPISDFFEGLADPVSGAEADTGVAQALQTFLSTSEGLELAEVFPRIGHARLRRQVLDLVRAMSSEPPET